MKIVQVTSKPCPHCDKYSLQIEYRLEALPLGTYSLAGTQEKYAVKEWPYLKCTNCGLESRGEYEPNDGKSINIPEST